MTLEELPDGETVVIDANIFIYHFTGTSAECTALLKRCQKGLVRGVTSVHIVLEVLHRLMMLEAVGKGLVGGNNIAQKLRAHPLYVQQLDGSGQDAVSIPDMQVEVLAVEPAILSQVDGVRKETGLLANDSLLVAMMRRGGYRNLATNDADFTRVAGITVFWPTDFRPA